MLLVSHELLRRNRVVVDLVGLGIILNILEGGELGGTHVFQ